MPEETLPQTLQSSHRSQSIRVGVEALIAVLVGIVTYNANQLTNDLERTVERVRLIEITAEGAKQRANALEQRLNSLVATTERQWSEIRDIRNNGGRR